MGVGFLILFSFGVYCFRSEVLGWDGTRGFLGVGGVGLWMNSVSLFIVFKEWGYCYSMKMYWEVGIGEYF